jgi:chemotaxis methyl-accepting protein methylase
VKFVVSDQTIARLRDQLSERIGYVLPPEFRAFMVRQLKLLLDELHLDSPDALADTLDLEPNDSHLWRRLISRMTIGESYLFRNPNHIDVLQRVILPHVLALSHQRPVALWSAGCSRGEEPYTLAILLHELDPHASERPISIIATDIDSDALADARKANYGSWAFRQTPFFIQRKYFTKVSESRLQLKAEVSRMVRFGLHHLSYPPPPDLFPTQGFDLILCRNVMMYFRADFREMAGRTLAHALSPEGVLITGQVEKVEGVDDILERHFIHSTPLYSHAARPGSVELVRLLQAGSHEQTSSHPPRTPARGTTTASPSLISPASRSSSSATLPRPTAKSTPPTAAAAAKPTLASRSSSSATLPRPTATKPTPPPDAPPTPTATAGFDRDSTSRVKLLLAPWQAELDTADPKPLSAPTILAHDNATLNTAQTYARIRETMCAGHTPEARKLCADLIAADPLNAAHHCLLAMVFLEDDDQVGAIDALRRATYCDPDSLTAFYLWWLIGTRYHGQRWERTRWAKRHLERLTAPLEDSMPLPLLSGVTVGDIRYLLARRWDAFDA